MNYLAAHILARLGLEFSLLSSIVVSWSAFLSPFSLSTIIPFTKLLFHFGSVKG